MTRHHRRLVIAVLLPAVAAGVLTSLLGSLAISYSIDRFPDGVSVTYLRVSPSIRWFVAGAPRPSIRVTDVAGRRVAGVVINLYAGLPQARVAYLGSVSGEGASAPLDPTILNGIRRLLQPEWRSALGSVRGFEAPLLAFVDVLVPAGGALKVYSFVKTVPVNLWMLARGYRVAAVRMSVNTAGVKPTVVGLGTPVDHGRAAPGGAGMAYPELRSGCVAVRVFRGGALEFYCSRWVLEGVYARVSEELIPIVMAKVAASPQAVASVLMQFYFNCSALGRFTVYASVKVLGSPRVTLQPWQSFNRLTLDYSMIFLNSRWTTDKPSFRPPAIMGIGFYGSALLDEFRRYDALRYCVQGRCWGPYRPTGVTANVTALDVDVARAGGAWRGRYGYVVASNPGVESGLSRFWEGVLRRSAAGVKVLGKFTVSYAYTGGCGDGDAAGCVGIGVDLLDLPAISAARNASGGVWEGFPAYAGIGWGGVGAVTISAQAHCGSESVSYCVKNSYVLLEGRVLKGRVYLGRSPVRLRAMYFSIYAYARRSGASGERPAG